MAKPFPFMHETRQRERDKRRAIRAGLAAGRACLAALESAAECDRAGPSAALARALHESAARDASARAFKWAARAAALS